jgi:hypothetical protein
MRELLRDLDADNRHKKMGDLMHELDNTHAKHPTMQSLNTGKISSWNGWKYLWALPISLATIYSIISIASNFNPTQAELTSNLPSTSDSLPAQSGAYFPLITQGSVPQDASGPDPTSVPTLAGPTAPRPLLLPDFYLNPQAIFFSYGLDQTLGIRSMTPGGTAQNYSLDDAVDFWPPQLMSFSPDKSKLFYFDYSDGFKLLDLKTGSIKTICSGEDCWTSTSYPIWSPDGKKFIQNAGDRLVAYDVEKGYHETLISDWPASSSDFIGWLSDGRFLVNFLDSSIGKNRLGYLDTSNNFTEINLGLGEDELIALATLNPQQTQLAYSINRWVDGAFQKEIYLSSLVGTSRRMIAAGVDIANSLGVEDPILDCLRFSSDGKKLMFVTWSGDQYYTNSGIFSYDLASKSLSQLQLKDYSANPYVGLKVLNCPDW